MGLMSLFNPTGFLMDKLQDKLQEKVKTPDRSKFLSSVMGGLDKAQNMQGKASEFIQEATGINDVRERLLSKIEGIADREIPEAPKDEEGVLDKKKFLGISAGEWMARLGAGMSSAGGGNGQQVYANYLNKQAAKDARRESQRDARQRALESRDDDILSALTNLDSTMTAAQSSAAGNLLSAATQLENKATEAALRVMEQDAADSRQLVGIRATYDENRQQHVERIREADHAAELTLEQIDHAAALNLRNEKVAELTALGLNPAAMSETINKYSTGDFESMTPQNHAQLRMWTAVSKARTDEERRAAILTSVSNAMGTRVHARDQLTGEFLYGLEGEPVFTNITTAEGAMKFVLGDKQSALDAITANPIQAEIDAQTEFFENAGVVGRSPRHQLGRSNPNAFAEALGGFPSSQDAVRDRMGPDAVTGEQLREQQRQLGPLIDRISSDFEMGATMLDVTVGLKKAKMAPEIIQSVMQKAMELGYWDGQEDKERIEVLLGMGYNVHPSAYEQP